MYAADPMGDYVVVLNRAWLRATDGVLQQWEDADVFPVPLRHDVRPGDAYFLVSGGRERPLLAVAIIDFGTDVTDNLHVRASRAYVAMPARYLRFAEQYPSSETPLGKLRARTAFTAVPEEVALATLDFLAAPENRARVEGDHDSVRSLRERRAVYDVLLEHVRQLDNARASALEELFPPGEPFGFGGPSLALLASWYRDDVLRPVAAAITIHRGLPRLEGSRSGLVIAGADQRHAPIDLNRVAEGVTDGLLTAVDDVTATLRQLMEGLV